MKLFSTLSRRPSRHRTRRQEGGAGFAVAAGLAAGVVLGAGCVTQGRFDETVAAHETQEAQLEQRLELLETSAQSLGKERVRLLDELETMRQERDDLRFQSEQQTEMLRSLKVDLSTLESKYAERNAEVDRLRGTYDSLVADLESEVATGQIEIEQLRDGVRLQLSDDILFPSGSATLNDGGMAVLRKVAKELQSDAYEVEVLGHTDNLKIRGSLAKRFPSNWELAGARAAAVVRLLESAGVSGARLAAVSRGPYVPVAENTTPEGRQRNRRIEIRLIPTETAGPIAKGS